MSEWAIRAQGLSKRYFLNVRRRPKMLREFLSDASLGSLRRLVGKETRPPQNAREFWALDDVSFDVRHGDVVAIVGRNGAGKSTLLKVLSRITEPTRGAADIYGRVGSLLEVGTGFHAELSGRENIYLNGAILGMSRREISRKFDEIVAFAEVEKFVDTPVKHYSSGMGLRLGFAVAAHLEPEILIVDEVLAVGDAAFQKKCLGKMGEVAKHGRTVLFVSHNMAAVKSLCQTGVLLEAGKVKKIGPVSEVVERYLNDGANRLAEQIWEDASKAPGDERARLRAVRVTNAAGATVDQVGLSTAVALEVEYDVLVPDTILNLSAQAFAPDDTCAFTSTNLTDEKWYAAPHPVGRYRSRCAIPADFLNTGRYSFSVFLVERARHIVAQVDRVVSVEMIDLGERRGGYFGAWPGAVRPLLNWSMDVTPNTSAVPGRPRG